MFLNCTSKRGNWHRDIEQTFHILQGNLVWRKLWSKEMLQLLYKTTNNYSLTLLRPNKQEIFGSNLHSHTYVLTRYEPYCIICSRARNTATIECSINEIWHHWRNSPHRFVKLTPKGFECLAKYLDRIKW